MDYISQKDTESEREVEKRSTAAIVITTTAVSFALKRIHRNKQQFIVVAYLSWH